MESEHNDSWRYILDLSAARGEMARAHRSSGDELLKRREWRDAGAAYEQAVRLNPDDAASWSGTGICWVRMGNLSRAEGCFRYALALDHACAPALLGMCDLRRTQARMDDAMVWLVRAQGVMGETHDVMLHKAQIALECDQFEDAVKISRKLCEERPESPISWSVLGIAQGNAGDNAGSLASLAKAWRIAPDDPEIRLNYGFGLMLEGQYKEGWKHYEGRLSIPSAINGACRFKSVPEWAL